MVVPEFFAGMRNVSVALVVASQNFSAGNTLVFVLVAAIISLLVLLPTAKRLGGGQQTLSPQPTGEQD